MLHTFRIPVVLQTTRGTCHGLINHLRLPRQGLSNNWIHTYFNPATGVEFSGVAGFTYNFKNQDTQYQNGIDFHFDWGASKFLSKQVFVGFVGYAYQQVTDDFGQNPALGGFRSRVLGVGPQLGSATCRASWASKPMANSMRPTVRRAGTPG